MSFLQSAVLILMSAIAINFIPLLLKGRRNYPVHGNVKEGWGKVADVFRHNLITGIENGASIAVYHKGELVVNLWGGAADVEAEWEIEENSLFQIYSSTKVFAAVAIAILVERGFLEYDKPVAKYWPEFGQNGKELITLEQLLSHQAGLADLDDVIDLSMIRGNPMKLSQQLTEQKPNWPPGAGHGYHLLTFGLYIDQIIQRIDPHHRTIDVFLQDEVFHPLEMDMYIGLPRSEFYRSPRAYAATLFNAEIFQSQKYWPMYYATAIKAYNDPKSITPLSVINNPYWKSYPCSSTGGFTTAQSLAKFYAMLENEGTWNTKKILSPEAIDKLMEPITSGMDRIVFMNTTFSRGLVVLKNSEGGMTYGTPGAGGQVGYFQPDNDLAVAYVTNHHSIFVQNDSPKFIPLEKAILHCLHKLNEDVK